MSEQVQEPNPYWLRVHLWLLAGHFGLCILIALCVTLRVPFICDFFTYHTSQVGLFFIYFLILILTQLTVLCLHISRVKRWITVSVMLLAVLMHPEINPVTRIYSQYFIPHSEANKQIYLKIEAVGGQTFDRTEFIQQFGPPLYYCFDYNFEYRGLYTNGSRGISVLFRDGKAHVIGATWMWLD